MDVTPLALTWFGWPNDEKLALTCVQIFNLRLLATPFDQGFRELKLCLDIYQRPRARTNAYEKLYVQSVIQLDKISPPNGSQSLAAFVVNTCI